LRADADGDAAADFPAALCAFEEGACFVAAAAFAAGFRVLPFEAVLTGGAAVAALLAAVGFVDAALAGARFAGAAFAAVVLLAVVLLAVVFLVAALLAVVLAEPDSSAARPRTAVPAAFLAALVTAERAAEATRCATPRAERPPVCWGDPVFDVAEDGGGFCSDDAVFFAAMAGLSPSRRPR
jgi:hypothetical protein